MNYLDSVVQAQKAGEARGITSICSAHPYVLEAALQHGLSKNMPVLIEATCNQVNQFGGYTGMTPERFVRFVGEIAGQAGFPRDQLLLGGDHLGPLVWSNEPANAAMDKAKKLVQDYALAGFGKIHLDCSMPCVDDRNLSVERIAIRTAELARAAEDAYSNAGLPLPRYVVGSEVPSAGGAKTGESHLNITSPTDAAKTIESMHKAFKSLGLESAWERVIALVVQPGVEFGDATVHKYDRVAAAPLARFIETIPGIVYEAHSTDYQTSTALRQLVEDHFAILKVGPTLTFAFREGVFALAEMEEALAVDDPSRIREILEETMMKIPDYWIKHYGGSAAQQKFSRSFSFSDRVRYYWSRPEVETALNHLMKNMGDSILPLSLISQYFPKQHDKLRAGLLPNHPRAFLLDKVKDMLTDYTIACNISIT